MAKMTISIPDHIREQMTALDARVNWSALAAEVFDREVRKSKKVDAMNTEQVVERLRASYEETKSADQEEGHTAGVDWASTDAEAAELAWMDENEESAADYLHEWRVDDSPFEGTDHRDFWRLEVNESAPPRAFVEGFVEGALEVWESVKDQVRD